jgi:hypothetical protein
VQAATSTTQEAALSIIRLYPRGSPSRGDRLIKEGIGIKA